ncbi:hypothetical protein [Enterococcus faecalis]|uniref:hypothetical protein n=1 Tax=Enterococcus faecalis TaxID=1351 RepID=UPI0020744C16|nr:hypothetical protein [Enterococcus faecalis]MCM6933030.1 hypothetical protein [Enterococcus faecalis]
MFNHRHKKNKYFFVVIILLLVIIGLLIFIILLLVGKILKNKQKVPAKQPKQQKLVKRV